MFSGNKCQNCGKGIMYGHNVSHSKRRTRRIFKPNLHTVRVEVDGVLKRMKLCSKCTRLLKGKSTRQKKLVKTEVPQEAPRAVPVSA
jgi:large subunit ribosomal protein L28